MKETTLLGCSYSGFQDTEAERVRLNARFLRETPAVIVIPSYSPQIYAHYLRTSKPYLTKNSTTLKERQ